MRELTPAAATLAFVPDFEGFRQLVLHQPLPCPCERCGTGGTDRNLGLRATMDEHDTGLRWLQVTEVGVGHRVVRAVQEGDEPEAVIGLLVAMLVFVAGLGSAEGEVLAGLLGAEGHRRLASEDELSCEGGGGEEVRLHFYLLSAGDECPAAQGYKAMKLCESKQEKLFYCCYFDGQRKTRRPRPPGWKGGSVSACFDDVGSEGEYDDGRQKHHRGQNDPGKDHSHPRPPFAIRLNELSNSIRRVGPALK